MEPIIQKKKKKIRSQEYEKAKLTWHASLHNAAWWTSNPGVKSFVLSTLALEKSIHSYYLIWIYKNRNLHSIRPLRKVPWLNSKPKRQISVFSAPCFRKWRPNSTYLGVPLATSLWENARSWVVSWRTLLQSQATGALEVHGSVWNARKWNKLRLSVSESGDKWWLVSGEDVVGEQWLLNELSWESGYW